MSTTASVNKVTRQARLGQAIAGIQKYFSNVPAITLNNTSYSPAALVGVLQKSIDAAAQTSEAKAAWATKVQLERNTIKEVGPVLRLFRSFVVAQFGDTQDSSNKLEAFGFTPRKVRSKDVAVMAEAAVKVRATRAARGTKGTRQKAKIKGNVAPQPQTSGSAATPPAPAASTAPAQVKPAS